MPTQKRSTQGKTVTEKAWQKVKQPKVARVELELRAGGGLHGPETPGWSAGGKEQQPGNVKTSSEEKQQQSTSQKPPGGSSKQSTIAKSFVEFA